MSSLLPDSVPPLTEAAPAPGTSCRGRLDWALLVILLGCPLLNVFAVRQPEGLFADFASNGVHALAAMLGAFFFLRAQYQAEEPSPASRRAWWLISIGASANALASMLYLLMVWFELPKFPSPADFFLVSFGLLSVTGLWMLPRSTHPRGYLQRSFLALFCGASLVLYLVWLTVDDSVLTFYTTARMPHRVLATIYLSIDLSLVLSSVWALLRRDRALVPRWPLSALCVTFLLLGFADTLQVHFMATRIHSQRVVVEHAWCLVSVGLGLSGFLRLRSPGLPEGA